MIKDSNGRFVGHKGKYGQTLSYGVTVFTGSPVFRSHLSGPLNRTSITVQMSIYHGVTCLKFSLFHSMDEAFYLFYFIFHNFVDVFLSSALRVIGKPRKQSDNKETMFYVKENTH